MTLANQNIISASSFLNMCLTLSFLAIIGTCNAFVATNNKHFVSTHAFSKNDIARQSLEPVAFYTKKSSSSTTSLYMGWGPEPIWSSATVISNDVACPSETCVTIKVSVPAETAEEYKIPGQYVQLRLNDAMENVLFLAIASAPSEENVFEFLIKKTDNNDWITAAQSGQVVQISQVLGNGFPYEENFDDLVKFDFPTQNVLLFAAGSGIAPIKAVIESNCINIGKPGSGGRTARLYYGVRNTDDICFISKFSEWEANGYQVVPVLSDANGDWNGRTGYVQNALEEDGVPVPRNSGAMLCGMKEMAESVKDILTKAGVFEGRVLTNF